MNEVRADYRVVCDLPRHQWYSPTYGVILSSKGIRLIDCLGYYAVVAHGGYREFELYESAIRYFWEVTE